MKQKSIEDYLRIIHLLGGHDKARISNIAKELGVTKPSVTKMMKKLAEESFIRREAYSEIILTKKGLAKARKIQRKFNIIKEFLRTIGYKDEKKICEEAHKLEHSFSDRTIMLLRKKVIRK